MLSKARCKNILALAITELGNDNQISELTVRQISEYCGLSSTTFYYHFNNKNDLLIWMYEKQLDRIRERPKESSLLDCLRYFIKQILRKRRIVLRLLDYIDISVEFKNLFRETTINFIIEEIEKRDGKEILDSTSKELISMYVYGLTDYLIKWLLDEDQENTVIDLMEVILLSTPDFLKRYITYRKTDDYGLFYTDEEVDEFLKNL